MPVSLGTMTPRRVDVGGIGRGTPASDQVDAPFWLSGGRSVDPTVPQAIKEAPATASTISAGATIRCRAVFPSRDAMVVLNRSG